MRKHGDSQQCGDSLQHLPALPTRSTDAQLEVAFDSMAELEAFWGAIPPERHRAWSQRAQHLIVDGSPT